NDNGSGQRGDIKAVIQQILMDGAARQGSVTESSTSFGRQREPMMRLTGPARAFPAVGFSANYTQLTGVNANKLRIVTTGDNQFSTSFPVSLDFHGNYSPAGQTLSPSNVPTSTTYTISGTTPIAKVWAGVSSIPVSSPVQVVTSEPHGLSTGNSVI